MGKPFSFITAQCYKNTENNTSFSKRKTLNPSIFERLGWKSPPMCDVGVSDRYRTVYCMPKAAVISLQQFGFPIK